MRKGARPHCALLGLSKKENCAIALGKIVLEKTIGKVREISNPREKDEELKRSP